MTTPDLRDLLSDPTALRLRLTDVAIDAQTVWVPDAILERSADGPAHFALRLAANQITFFGAQGRRVRAISTEERTEIVRAALAALRAGDVEPEMDTAVGRYMTELSVSVRLPGLPGDAELPALCSLRINHNARGGGEGDAWLRLIEVALWAAAELMSDEDREHLEFCRAHFASERVLMPRRGPPGPPPPVVGLGDTPRSDGTFQLAGAPLDRPPEVSWDTWLDAARTAARAACAVHEAGGNFGGNTFPLEWDAAGTPHVLPPPAFGHDTRSPYTASPETYAGGRATPASDVFALGHTLHQLLDGGSGLEHVELMDLARLDIASGDIRWRRDGIAAPVCALIAHMVRPIPTARPTMREVLEALEALDPASLGPLGPLPTPRPSQPPRLPGPPPPAPFEPDSPDAPNLPPARPSAPDAPPPAPDAPIPWWRRWLGRP